MASASPTSPLDINGMFYADIQQRTSRQAEGAIFDNRLLNGFLASTLLASNDSSLNAAVRIPTTLGSGSSTGVNPSAS